MLEFIVVGVGLDATDSLPIMSLREEVPAWGFPRRGEAKTLSSGRMALGGVEDWLPKEWRLDAS